MDDYYIHKINIIHKHKLYSFNLNFIQVDNQENFEWISSYAYKNISDSLQFNIKKQTISIKINYKNNQLNLSIKKSKNFISNYYLDIFFDNIKSDDKRYDGLIGFIGKQHIIFIYPIQNIQIGTILINNSEFKTTEKLRNNKKCWLVNFDDIIYPFKKDKFIK